MPLQLMVLQIAWDVPVAASTVDGHLVASGVVGELGENPAADTGTLRDDRG